MGKLCIFHCAPLSWWLEKAVNNNPAYPLTNSLRVALTN